MGHLSGREVYKADLFVPFIKIRKMDEVVTEFSMEKLVTMPKGAWREFASPSKDRTGRVKIAMNQLVSTGTHRVFSVYVLPEKMMELFNVTFYWRRLYGNRISGRPIWKKFTMPGI
jgi:hypothetical protein